MTQSGHIYLYNTQNWSPLKTSKCPRVLKHKNYLDANFLFFIGILKHSPPATTMDDEIGDDGGDDDGDEALLGTPEVHQISPISNPSPVHATWR